MFAAVAAADSPLGSIQMQSVPRPAAPAPGEVLIRVTAAGVNPVDVKSRQGRGAASFLTTDQDPASAFPWIPGWDVAGEIVETGRGVAKFAAGERVFGTINFPRSARAYAQYVLAPVAHLSRTPDRLNDLEAAALPMAGLTAWQSLFYAGGLRADQTVLVTGAAGGVGHLAVQIARDAGAHVVAVASPANLDFVRELGAHDAVDRTSPGWTERVDPVDLVLDMFGGPDFDNLYGAIKPGGDIVTVSSASLDRAPTNVRAMSVVVASDGHCLHQLADAADRGAVTPHVSTVLPLPDAGCAHELIESGRTRGKIVLDLSTLHDA